MAVAKWSTETEEEDLKKQKIIESLKRDGYWRPEVGVKKSYLKTDIRQPLSVLFNWREARIILARLRRIAHKAGMSRNAWLVWQIKELVEIHDYENL